MQFKTIMATAAIAVSLGSFAQPAHSENRSSGPLTSNAHIETMMRNMDRFQARQDRIERSRYYAEQKRIRGDQYAERSSYPVRR